MLAQAADSPLSGEVDIRPATEADLPFVLDSWLRSYRKHVDCAQPIYDRFQREVAERLLLSSRVYVACNAEEPSQVFGYLVAGRKGPLIVLHYVYVKQVFRRFGIATALLRHLGAVGCHYTHRTRAGAALMARWRAYFNPFLLPGDS